MSAIPIPPAIEQQQILDEVKNRMAIIGRVEAEIDKQISRSNRLRQSILTKAFSGELVQQDASEESAKTTLDQIQKIGVKMTKKKLPKKNSTKRRASKVSNTEELVALLKQLGGTANPERLLLESKLDQNVDEFFEIVREASISNLICAPVGKFGEISLSTQ